MPFVQRQVEPKFVSRSAARNSTNNACGLSSSSSSAPLRDNELEAITNLTLANAMRQLSSLLALSKEIFTELNRELELVSERSTRIKTRLTTLHDKVEDPSYDAKLVVVPESDLVTFVQIKNHVKTDYKIQTNLFTIETRTESLAKMYANAAQTPVATLAAMDELLGIRGRRSSDAFICTPILERTRRRLKNNIDIEIETRLPAAVEDLRKWTSSEAIGDETVAPNCVARVAHNTSVNVADQSAMSLRAGTADDCTDSIIMITNSSSNNNGNMSGTDDEQLDHRLPSPHEQCLILASKYPAQIVRVDTSGKRFERQSAARKSLLHVQTGLHAIEDAVAADSSNNSDSVKRRSRSRKPRGNRRNTIAGIDQKEIEGIAVNGDASDSTAAAAAATAVLEMSTFRDTETAIVPRSKSSDVLKRDLLSTEAAAKRSSSHFNSLKQWGKSRLRMINRLSGASDDAGLKTKHNSDDIDDFNVLEAINKRQKKINEKDRRLSHERKPSYSSSERSLNATASSVAVASSSSTAVALPTPSNGTLTASHIVKMREQTAVIRRQRRTGAAANRDEPHSSSGNWSASSESGRTSIGSEITTTTTHPKSSASSTSLNHHTHHSSSGPPSSIISRRRFLNTSASSSVTSEGTATPELQMFEGAGAGGDDAGETSSVYSCDTEGYYTSFHVDSGLKTLKEEESLTPMQSSMALSSTNSFESSGNQTVISPECEYELFGKGSTTTTSSSAGTVCTAVLSPYGPSVPERKSSLGKLNRSGSSGSSSTNLERSYSTSTVGSTLEKSGTIKRNGVLLQKEVAALVHQQKRVESPDSGNNTSSSPIDSNSSPTHQNARLYSEFECSESSDLECVERTERIRVKTKINTSRIPSIVAITPSPSDDDESACKRHTEEKIKIEENVLNVNRETGYATVLDGETKITRKTSPLMPLNHMLDKLRGVLHPLKKSPGKQSNSNNNNNNNNNDEYVTITDVGGGKSAANGIYYSADVLKRNLATVLSGNIDAETEYVSLNELPCNVRCERHLSASGGSEKIDGERGSESGGDEQRGSKGAIVRMDAHGKPIFDSNSLRRKQGAITTFSPGPCVKTTDTLDAIVTTTTTKVVVKTTLASQSPANLENHNTKVGGDASESDAESRASEDRVKTQASEQSKKTEAMSTTRPNGVLSLNLNSVSSKVLAQGTMRGAYVNIQDAAPLRNGPPVYSPPSPSRAASIFAQPQPQQQQQQQIEDYQPLYHETEYAYQYQYQDPMSYDAPFQRNSNTYWTLQPRQKAAPKDFDALYSTPSKPPTRDNLRTTNMGFDFFSPVPTAKLDERILEESESMSPIDPRSGGFHTSTPQKSAITMSPLKSSLTEDLRARLRGANSGIRSHGNSPISSGRSTPKCVFEPQQSSRTRHSWSANNVEVPSSTCSDRLGAQKTSLMDFKKLLLNKTTSTHRVGKISAVEALKMSKASPASSPVASSSTNNSTMNILDLSGSPKTFATRRMIRQGQFGQGIANSPTKPGGKAKHTWRMQNMRTDVISTAIPEAAQDEEVDNSPNASQQSNRRETIKSPEIVIREAEDEEEEEQLVSSIKENLFIKQEENNFTENEIREHKKLAPHHVTQQQQRANFLFGAPATSSATTPSSLLTVQQSNNNKTAIFKNGGHYAGIVTSGGGQGKDKNVQPASLETAL